jgi:uncharacterized membrane protein
VAGVSTSSSPASTTPLQDVTRWALGAFLTAAGTGHLTFARRQFQAQVPPWVPMDADRVVLASGAVEIVLGTALVAVPRQRGRLGRLAAALFVAVFPGNISQWRHRIDGLGLTTDTHRALRLFLQPLLVLWALWSTGNLGRR